MIKIIAGGKKHQTWVKEAIYEYEKRLKKPFNVIWELMEEEKLTLCLEKWMFSKQQCIVILDERGRNFSSVEFSEVLAGQFEAGREVIFIIGGAYGIGERARGKADLVWSFSRLVFPHQLMRVMIIEQIYRAQEIWSGGKYHHG